jgi:site-specific recombinase XerD
MQNVNLKTVLTGVGSGGCVQQYLEGFAAELISAGYALLSIRDYVRSAAHLGRWMDSRNLGIDRIGEDVIAEFASHKCKCPFFLRGGRRPSRRYVKRVRRFADYLGRHGVASSFVKPSQTNVPEPLVGFTNWMTQHRGVKPPTVKRYETLVRELLPALGDNPAAYDAALVRQVVIGKVKDLSPGYAKTYVGAMRAFLRFLAANGRCRPSLDRAVPTVPEWKLSALPRYLERDAVERLITSCDLSKPFGVRDRAILLLLARLGLRAGDITAMRLDDLDWHAGTVRVLGKGRREVCLPLPQDAGDALIEYLNVRPKAATDRVFLCTNAPVRPFATSSSISDIVRLALQRAGIVDAPSKGAHLLRHSAATGMLRSGASLDVIATVLRHQSSDTTAYYAKVDIELLGRIAQPWPEGTSC